MILHSSEGTWSKDTYFIRGLTNPVPPVNNNSNNTVNDTPMDKMNLQFFIVETVLYEVFASLKRPLTFTIPFLTAFLYWEDKL